MPFIDVFSMLNTFLLFSAVFLSIGIIEVQIPFMSNATPPKDKPARILDIKVDIAANQVVMTTSYTAAPRDERKYEYTLDEVGLGEMHKQLMSLRQSNPDSDSVTVFSDDDVVYEKLTAVLDSIKFLREGESVSVTTSGKGDGGKENRILGSFLYEKIVIGSVLL